MRTFVTVLVFGSAVVACLLLAMQVSAALQGSGGVLGLKLTSTISLVALSAACWLIVSRSSGRRSLIIVLACVAGSLGAISMVGHMFALELPIDRGTAPGPLGRMGGNSAMLFMALAAGITLDFSSSRKLQLTADAFVLLASMISLTSLIAYLFASRAQYPFAQHDPMALPTAMIGIASSIALVLQRPERGLGRLLHSSGSGGVMARRLIPVLLIVPVLIARLALLGVEAGAFDSAFAAALSVIGSVAILVFLLAGTAQVVERLEAVRRGNEAQIRQMVQDLTRTNRELESFSYSISHDLRAPIRHIAGFTELLGAHTREQLDAKGKKYLATIGESAENAGRLIDDLLEFSRIGRSALQRRDVDLRALIEDQWRRLSIDRRDRQIRFVLDAMPHVDADPTLIGVVIANLLSNAIKYTERRDDAVIEVRARRDGGEVVVSVRDNGVGFDMKYVDKLFGVFQRLHGEEFAGTGIGLASIKRIVERHGGRVWAEGVVDHGATFHFSLPAVKEATS